MQDIGLGAGLAALGFWLFIAAAVAGGIWDGIRKREAQHETLRRLIETGQPLDQALIDRLLGLDKRPDQDLRAAALICFGIAPGLAILGWLISLQAAQALLPLIGVALLVACIGGGLLLAARTLQRGYETPGSRTGQTLTGQ